jgi:hypothetical protein
VRYQPLTCLFVTLCLCVSGSSARTVFVPGDFTNMQEAVDSLHHGDTILVMTNFLSGYGNRDVNTDGKRLVIHTAFGPGGVTIDCQADSLDQHRAFVFDSNEDSLTIIDGFRIVNGWADTGGAILTHRAAPTLRNMVFEYNNAVVGGAIGGFQGAPIISSCRFQHNTAVRGGAIDGLGRTFIRNSRFTSNHASQRGGAIADLHSAVVQDCVFDHNTGGGATFDLVGGSARIERCLFAQNASGGLSVVYGYQSMQIERCTFYGNAYGMQALGDTYIVPRNTMIVFNRGDAAFCSITDSVTILLNHCNVFGNVRNYFGCIANNISINGNLSVDPQFCDTAAFDFTLHLSSSCVSAGINGVPIGAYGVGCTPTSVGEEPSGLPATIELAQNYPNPFNPSTTIRFSVPHRSAVAVTVYNILGERIAVLLDQTVAAGWYDVSWDGRIDGGVIAASGVYFYRLSVDGTTESRKMLLLK